MYSINKVLSILIIYYSLKSCCIYVWGLEGIPREGNVQNTIDRLRSINWFVYKVDRNRMNNHIYFQLVQLVV